MNESSSRNSAHTLLLLTAGLSSFLCSASTAATLIFDLGLSGQETTGANNFTGDGVLNDPVTTGGGSLTGVTVTLTGIQGPNNSGPTSPTGSLGTIFVGDTTRDSLYGNGSGFIPTLVFTGLDPMVAYTFDFGATRATVTDTRTTEYTVTGANMGSAILNTSNNTSETVTVSNISPTAGGILTITTTKPADNDGGFIYLGGIRMTSVPEPSGMLLTALSGGMFLLRRRKL